MNKKLLKLIIHYLNKPKFIFGMALSFIGAVMSLFVPRIKSFYQHYQKLAKRQNSSKSVFFAIAIKMVSIFVGCSFFVNTLSKMI